MTSDARSSVHEPIEGISSRENTAVEAASAYLRSVNKQLPGRITGFYLVGSVALGDYRPRRSDVDFVAVTEMPLEPAELDRLAQIHAELRRVRGLPAFDGVYVTYPELLTTPVAGSAPYYLDGRFHQQGAFATNPVTWATLRLHPFRICGPDPLPVWHDDAVLRQWCTGNLLGYWTRWVGASRTELVRKLYGLSRHAAAWGVLGVARLHVTIRTGEIFSKTAAGEYALATFSSRWAPIITDALATRRGHASPSRLNPFSRRREMLAFMEHVIADAAP